MNRLLKSLLITGCVVFTTSSFARDDGTGSVNSGSMPQFDGQSMAEVIQVLSGDVSADRTFPPICDSLGIVWNLTKSGSSITGTASISSSCGLETWGVTGGNTGADVSLTADNPGTCFCNSQFTMVGTVTPATRSFTGTHTQTVGCPGSVPVTAGLCP